VCWQYLDVMGEMLQIACSSCGFDRVVFAGCGISGQCSTLCWCERCTRFVLKRDPGFGRRNAPTCPYCRRVVDEITRSNQTHIFEQSPNWRCQSCGGHMTIEECGIWD
jgi:hypothetical protein